MSTARRAGAGIAVTDGGPAGAAARALLRAELDGVRFLGLDGEGGGEPRSAVLRDVDMLVFVVDADDAIDRPRVAAVAGDARARGILIAAIVVSRAERFGNAQLLAALRDAADMVMIVRDPDDVRAVVAALR